MEVTEDGKCFVCGPHNPIGLKATFSLDHQKHSAESRLIIGEPYQGWQGVVHGGVIAALLDEAAIYACRTLGNQLVTVELNAKYKKPVPSGREVVVRAEVTEQKKRILQVSSRLELEGQVLALAEVRVYRID